MALVFHRTNRNTPLHHRATLGPTFGPHTRRDLLGANLDGLEQDLKQYVVTIEEEALLQSYDVQIFHETGVAILVHVIEHFSYHTGQIARDTKRMLAKDLRFYETEDL